jgi:hypothetical protein
LNFFESFFTIFDYAQSQETLCSVDLFATAVLPSTVGTDCKSAPSGFIPLKYVDKLEKKLFKKMNVSAEKMARYKNRMRNDSNRSASTRARNNKRYAENKKNNENYTKAFAGVKAVNDAYKAGGAEALQNIDLFKKTPEKKKSTVTVGELEEIKE